jgi:hypothetical protein
MAQQAGSQTQALPPRISFQRFQYFASRPKEWEQFLSQLPRIHAGPALAPPLTSPWQPVKAPAPAGGLSAPQLLTDGTVLVHQACSPNWYKLTPDLHGSYLNGTWSTAAKLPAGYGPLYFASQVLSDGRIIINGGEYNLTGGACKPVWTALGAIYNPVTNAWAPVSAPAGWKTVGDAQSVVLTNGTYMLATCCALPPQAALWNAAAHSWTATGRGKFDAYDEEGWTLLPDAEVLTADSYAFTGRCGKNTELYNPVTGRWASAGESPVQLSNCGMTHAVFEMGPQVLRADGTVAVFSAVTTGAVAGTAIFNPAARTWARGPNLPTIAGRNYDLADAPAAWIPNGKVLIAASPGFARAPTHFFELSTANAIEQVADTPNAPAEASYAVNFLLLPTGQILQTDFSEIVEIYTPSGSPNPSWAPVITKVPAVLVRGASYQLSGRQLNGLTQGAAYGDDAQSTTNYPLVRITNRATGHVLYARTWGFSTRSLAKNAASTAEFEVPARIETGASTLAVIANGIPSAAVEVTVR